MSAAVVIPARFASSRFPGKPLLRETGKFLVQHVYEQASRAKNVSRVVVATDDARIRDAVRSFGGDAVMTRADHATGTDRIAEVAAGLDAEVIVNLQGDEPLFEPEGVELLLGQLSGDCAAEVATLATPVRDAATYRNPNCVKVVIDDRGRAMLFSRSPVPFVRDGEPDFAAEPARFLLHLGVYAYRREALLRLAATPPHPLEELEKLEQLRLLAAGGVMSVGVVPHAHRGVDTPDDYAAFVRAYHGAGARRAA